MPRTDAAPTPVYELRRDGRTWVSSPLPFCGYDKATLKSLKAAGFKLYCDGKAVRI